MSSPIRGRFAPSPSGRMHLGNVFCALMSWLAVKSQGGEAVLRIEDLDIARCRPAYTEQLLDDLRFLGLEFNEGPQRGGEYAPYCQSERSSLYQQALDVLREKGMLYPCYCSRDELHAVGAPHASDGRVLYNGACRRLTEAQRASKTRAPAFRIKAYDKTYVWEDGMYGKQHCNVRQEWGDFVLRRSDGLFAYQLAVVVDDAAMGITQVVRGRDLLTSVAPQLQLYEALDLTPPHFYHIPLLLAPDGRRLSKRDKDLDMGELRKRYSSSEYLIGELMYLANMIDHEEAVSAKEAISHFSWERMVQRDIVLQKEWFLRDRL